ncbi:MAG TPA: site-specific integrase [Solirubrobacterales bacterium]|nr:site-specific integrase [Solirubrobacterales bacterium]
MRWRDEQGRERSRVIGRKRDAESFEAEVVRRKRTGDLDLLTGGRETLAEFAEEWWKLYAVPNLASRTLLSYAKLWDRHIQPRLGSMPLNAITPEVVERYRAELEADGVGRPTVHRALVQLQGVLRCAVEWRRIGSNPVKAVKKPKVRRYREVRPLSPIAVERLRVAAAGRRRKHGPRDATLIAVLAYAGVRPQEAQVLRWSDVRERTILVDKAADGQGGIKTTKTGQARTVRLLAPLAADLAEWRLRCDHDGHDELLFPNRTGGVWNDGAWQSWHRDAWHPACHIAGIEKARPYDLRHSFISLLIHEGRSVIEVACQAGHSPTMTLDVYAHVFDEFDVAERVSAEDQIAQARRDVSESCPPDSDGAGEEQKIPANPHNPINFPRISFITSSVPPPIGPRRASRTARSMPYSFM